MSSAKECLAGWQSTDHDSNSGELRWHRLSVKCQLPLLIKRGVARLVNMLDVFLPSVLKASAKCSGRVSAH